MYCPKCGGVLTMAEEGNYVCPGGLEFSVALTARLVAVYGTGTPGPAGTTPLSKRLFCPGCGLSSWSSDCSCSGCGVTLPRDVVHSLIELHPHPDGLGGYF